MLRSTRRLRLRHTTHYTYDKPIPRSVHRLHLRPIDDWRQNLLLYQLTVRPHTPVVEYEDVFGNWSQRFDVNEPYSELVITAESLVELVDTDPFAFAKLPIRPPSWPLVWMPWERTMLAPYLNPPELPDTQLRELYDYGMQFVTRNNGDLMETLFRMQFVTRNNGDLMETLFAVNLSLFRDYRYVQGCTDVRTSPYEVYCTRAGVCQDFTNLFITVARLLGVPARYVCGYIHTGNTETARASSDETHAWVELYVPSIGWKGFDPTNGVLPQTDHVRVAVGRHYRDATPTAGTLYGAGAMETMKVKVEVHDVLHSGSAAVLQAR